MKHLNNVKKSCNVSAMAVNHGSNTPQTERTQKIKSYMNSLPTKMNNEHSTLPKTMKSYDGSNDEFRVRSLAGTLEQQPQQLQQQQPLQSQPKPLSSGSSKSGGSSSSSKSESNNNNTNIKNGSCKSTGTIPKLNIVKCNINIIDEPAVYQSLTTSITSGDTNKIDIDAANIAESKNLNLIDGSAAVVKHCNENCESCRKVVEISVESKIASADNVNVNDDDDNGGDAIADDDVFEVDCRTECESTKMSKKSVSIYLYRIFA